jgi:small conductance mechanosensitive channel
VGIAYKDDIDQARKNLKVLKTGKEIISDEFNENFVVENELATSTVNLKVLFWTDIKEFRKSAMVTRVNIINKIKRELIAKVLAFLSIFKN